MTHSSDAEASPSEGVGVRFHAAFRAVTDPEIARPELVPVRLARACATALGTAGAGLSVMENDFRIPLGASDEAASFAERLQFTQGEGPCLDAARTRQVVVADSGQIDGRWPSFAAELFAHTPFRGVATIPLSLAASTRGALDLYLIDEHALGSVPLADAVTIADAVVETLAASDSVTAPAIDELTGLPTRSWLSAPSAQQRRFVWLAVGMVMSSSQTTAPDALALLRSYAYGHGTQLDDLAAALVDRRLTLDELQD